MAISTLMTRLTNYCKSRYSETEYSKDIVDDILYYGTYTPTTFNNTVLINWYHEYIGEFTVPGATRTVNLNPTSESYNQGLINWAGTWGDDPQRLVSLDIETWDMGTQADEALPYLQLYASMWKEQTTRQVGYYRLIPWAQITQGVGLHDASTPTLEDKWRALMTTYMQVNDRNASRLIDYVDFLVPRCYMMYHDWMSEWKFVTAWQILEAIRIAQGKPVYPIIWFKHHPASGDTAELAEADWTTCLQFISGFPGIAGTYVWTDDYTTSAYDWKDAVGDLISGIGAFTDEVPP